MRKLIIFLTIWPLLLFGQQNDCTFKLSNEVQSESLKNTFDPNGKRIRNSPYTMFNRVDYKLDSKEDIQNYLDVVRKKILKGQPNLNEVDFTNEEAHYFYSIWITAHDATKSQPWKKNTNDYYHADYVKCNAFLYLLRIKYQINANNKGEFVILAENDPLVSEWANKAYSGLANMCPIENQNEVELNDLRNKAIELVKYLNAYDMLKTGGWIVEGADKKWNKDLCLPRNKLRVFAASLYRRSDGIINSTSGWKKNHGIICASALGMAAIVLNDAGANFWHKKFQPDNWWKRSMGRWHSWPCLYDCEDGLRDNFFVGAHYFAFKDVPQSSADGMAGYAEGTGYFFDLLKTYLPFIRANANYLGSNDADNLLYNKENEKFINILKWYQGILNQDGTAPSMDNTPGSGGNCFGILGIKEFPGIPFKSLTELGSYKCDYLLARGFETGNLIQKGFTENERSGNIVLRNVNSKTQSKHSLHMLCETEESIDKEAFEYARSELRDGTHEDKDMGSYSIFVGEKDFEQIPLAIDPYYLHYSNVKGTNKYWMHNTIEIDDGIPGHAWQIRQDAAEKVYSKYSYSKIKEGDDFKEFVLSINYRKDKNKKKYEQVIKRNVTSFNIDGKLYYEINDLVDASEVVSDMNTPSDFRGIAYNLNGYGHIATSESAFNNLNMSFRKIGDFYRWSYPCRAANNRWALMATINTLDNYSILENFHTNNSYEDDGTKTSLLKEHGPDPYTTTHLKLFFQTDKALIQTFLFPLHCDEEFPKLKKSSNNIFTATNVQFFDLIDTSVLGRFGITNENTTFVKDTICHFHLNSKLKLNITTFNNPFDLNESDSIMVYDGKKLFISYHSLDYMGSGYKYCPPTYANFRSINSFDGTRLIYKDTLFYSDKRVNFEINLKGRLTYKCTINALENLSNSDSIRFKLPDASKGIEMIALNRLNGDTIPGRYDTLNCIYYIALSSSILDFIVQEKGTCKDCYFPPIGQHIDTIFEANDGLKHIVTHNLKIRRNEGTLKIGNSTKISICEGTYLLNQDSLVLVGPPQIQPMLIPVCTGIDSIISGSNNSMIIIGSGSALVLDSNSYTYIQGGAGVYVKANGSLVLKNGAILEIGDSGSTGWGELIAEPGSNIHIENGAILKFRKVITDTTDKNLIHIAVGNNYANSGIYWLIDSILINDNIVDSNQIAINICEIDSLNPILNNEWGFANIGRPKIFLKLRNDTLCPGEPLEIDLKRLLNDVSAEISVCRWDSLFDRGVFIKMVCINDTIALDSIPPDPTCKIPRILPDHWIWYFPVNSRHQVTIKLINDCGLVKDTSFTITVLDTPDFNFAIPDSICSGYTSFSAICFDNNKVPVGYSFEISELIDSSTYSFQLKNPSIDFSFTDYGLVPDTFKFENFQFKGGRKYLVSLSLINSCGVVTKYKTLNIPTGAFIELERPTVYANPINGTTSVQMRGYTTLADSFVWSPTTYLNRYDTLVVISSPEDQIYYTLTVYHNNCMATDTVWIKYNRIANAGEADTICYNFNGLRLGNAYDYSLFLGFLNYKGGNNFKDIIYEYTQNDSNFFRNFSVFMKQDEFISTIETYAPTFYSNFKTLFWRDSLINQTWFKDYWMSLLQFDDPKYFQLDTFTNRILESASLTDHINSLDDWSSISTCVDEIFKVYYDFQIANNINVSSTWTKVIDNDSLAIDEWNNRVLTYDYPTKNTLYINNVITPSYAEIDEVNILVDTAIQVYFAPVFQSDSSVFFESMLTPNQGNPIYSWNFGDGASISHEANPFHTFTAFDTSFRVCLTVFNLCGIYTFCDTIYIDSLHWGGSIEKLKQNTSTKESNNFKSINLDALVYPNPTESNATFMYKSVEENFEGKLVITDIGGRSIWETSLKQKSGNIKIPCQNWHDGLYFFHLQTSSGTKTGKFVVRH